MAVVHLDTVRLAAVTDLSAQVLLEVTSLSETDGKAGEVRHYANGRRRVISRTSRHRTVPLEFDLVDERDTLETLRGWCGQVVLYRDPRGRKVYGVFHELDIDENVSTDFASVSLTLTEVTYSEAV